MKNHTCTIFLVFCIWATALLSPLTAFSAGSPHEFFERLMQSQIDGFPQQTEEYSADRYLVDDEGEKFICKVYRTRDKERQEMELPGALIIRMDKRVMWILSHHPIKMYNESKLSEETNAGDFKGCDVRNTGGGGWEDVNGFLTHKEKYSISCPGEEKYNLSVWLTTSNIPIRMEIPEVAAQKQVFRLELKNLKTGKQDPALFEVPEGYIRRSTHSTPKQ